MLFSNPKHLANKKLPISPKGTAKITTIGMKRLSYSEHRIR